MSTWGRVVAFLRRPHLMVVALAALLVPRRLRREWRREWEGELRHRGSLDARALAFTAALALITGVAFAVVPIRRALRAALAESLKDDELGIRLTLGARPNDLLRLVAGQGLALTLSGAVLGLCGAFALTRYLRTLLFSVTPTDPLTFTLTPLLFVCVALLACWIPARRAMRLDPVRVLKGE